MKYLFLVSLIAVFCFGQIRAYTDPMQKMGSSSEIWVDAPAQVQASTNNLEPSNKYATPEGIPPQYATTSGSISSQPFRILVLITISLSLVVAIMLFSIFNSSSKKKPTSQNNLHREDNKSNFRIIDSCALDNGQNLYIVQFLERKFLLASTLTNISLIAEINSEIPVSEPQKPLASNLDFMTIQSEFNSLPTPEKAKANGFAALLNNNIIEEEIINETIEEISPDEIQTSRNLNKFQSFFNSKKNNSNEIPQLIQVQPTEEEAPKKEISENKTSLPVSKNKLLQNEVKAPKKPAWLQDKKIGSSENKFPINIKEKMAAEKALKSKINNINSTENNTDKTINSVANNNEKYSMLNNSNSSPRVASASQLASSINNQKNSIEALAPQKTLLPEISQMPEAVKSQATMPTKTSLRRISIVEE